MGYANCGLDVLESKAMTGPNRLSILREQAIPVNLRASVFNSVRLSYDQISSSKPVYRKACTTSTTEAISEKICHEIALTYVYKIELGLSCPVVLWMLSREARRKRSNDLHRSATAL